MSSVVPEDPLELELVVNHPVQVLGTEPRSSAKIVSAPNHQAISPALQGPLELLYTQHVISHHKPKLKDRFILSSHTTNPSQRAEEMTWSQPHINPGGSVVPLPVQHSTGGERILRAS